MLSLHFSHHILQGVDCFGSDSYGLTGGPTARALPLGISRLNSLKQDPDNESN